ncbi:hypothetical protein VNO77_22800 [Canavalia gladiata]|uniref:Uncharacterized protein n=1 Tax=Canavalia gladiata TaxID=3824 RepID=A0AAN9QET4_CANGL
MHQNAQLHALKNPRLLQIQHSPYPTKFIDLSSPFHLLLHHQYQQQPEPSPPSPPPPEASGAFHPPITTQAHRRVSLQHRSKNCKLRVFKVMKRNA